MSKIQEKVSSLMDEVQSMIEANSHLGDDIQKLEQLLSTASMYWKYMDDENRDYIHCVRYAIEHKERWDLNR